MSIEMENPESVPGKIDAAWNLVEQIGLALGIGDIAHAKAAKEKAARLLSAAQGQAMDQTLDGAGVIRAERERQIQVEGWTPEHDDKHDGGEMADAASCYANIAAALTRGAAVDEMREFYTAGFNGPLKWPWEESWWKPSEDPIRNLVKAGALIAAEIDRLQRIKARESDGG